MSRASLARVLGLISLAIATAPVMAHAATLELEEAKAINEPSPEVNAMAAAFDHVIARLGESTQTTRMIQDYRKILGLQSYGGSNFGEGNHGLKAYAKSLLQNNDDLQRKAGVFYNELLDMEERRQPLIPDIAIFEGQASESEFELRYPLGNRIALSHEVGQREFARLAPGWAYQRALSAARGNPNDAIRLIGLCGHDDVMQGALQVIHTPVGAERAMRLEKAKLERRRTGAAKKLKALLTLIERQGSTTPPQTFTELGQLEREIETLAEREMKMTPANFARAKLNCPAGETDLYVPKSLDAEADISDELKSKLIKTMAPQDLAAETRRLRTPGASLEAKYYHVYGAAFVSCEMIRKGHDPKLIVKWQKALAWSYRTVRMTEKIAELHQTRKQVATRYEAYKQAYWRALRHYLRTGEWVDDPEHQLGKSERSTLGRRELRPPRMKSLEEIFFRETKGELDGLILLHRWALGGGRLETPGFTIQLPQTNFPASIALQKPAEWTDERFARAKAQLKTHLLDWEWTIRQHEAGAEFSARVCRPDQ